MSERLFGLPGAERMYFDIESVEPDEPDFYEDRVPWIIEEWSVLPAVTHLPSAEHVLEYMAEWVGEQGEVDEYGCEHWTDFVTDPEVVAAAENLRTVFASKISYRMADKMLREHLVTWNEAGDPLLDGQPMYVSRFLDHDGGGVGE
jgi:hypothetical protein